MTPAKEFEADRPVTLDDLKQKAGRIRDIAETEVRRQVEDEAVRNIAIVVGVVAVAVGLAYFLGTRRAPVCPEPEPPSLLDFLDRF